jgi:IS30 family transposase
MLAKIRDNKTITVISALIKQARELPVELYKTLKRDRGAEMTSHTRFTIATDIQIYFCDPQSPWQRGSNENTNRLLRQYFPKGTDLSGSQPAKTKQRCQTAQRKTEKNARL